MDADAFEDLEDKNENYVPPTIKQRIEKHRNRHLKNIAIAQSKLKSLDELEATINSNQEALKIMEQFDEVF